MKIADCINGIGHLGIIVPELDKAIDFYVNKFGFELFHKKLVIDPLDGAINVAFVKQRDMILELFTPMTKKNEILSRKDGILDHFAIDCGDVYKEYKSLSKRGLKLHASTPDGVVNYEHLGCKGVIGVNFCGSFGEVVEVCSVGARDYNGVDTMQGWGHLAIKVHNLANTITFYKKLGFRQVGDGYVDTPYGRLLIAFMSCHGFILEIIQVCGALIDDLDKRGAGHIDHFALDVSNINEAYNCAKSEGLKILNPVIKELSLFDCGIAYFMIKGPDGEIIEINHIKKF